MYQIRKPSMLDVSRNQSTPTTSLNTTDISLHNANLESYKKALHNIVKKLNRTPSSSSKTSLKKSDSKLNQTQQPVYNSTFLNTSNSSKKHYVNNSYVNKNQPSSKRSQSNDGYQKTKDLLNKSMNEPYIRKESLSLNIARSISINKSEKQENHDSEDLIERDLLKGDHSYVQSPGLSSTILQDVDLNNLDTDCDKRLRDLVHKYQLRDAIHRQEITKLKKSNELLRSHIYDLEKEVDKNKKNREMEKRYISKLEQELNQVKEKMRSESVEKKAMTSNFSENKENQYLKLIEDLKAQVTNITSEKKLVEHLLKNALMQNDIVKETSKSDKQPISGQNLLGTSNFAINSFKYANIAGRVKTGTQVEKSATKYGDENDCTNMSIKLTKESESSKEPTKQFMSFIDAGKIEQNLHEANVNQILETEEVDEAFPNKVFHPQLNERSLKERIDLNKFKLDLSIISKNRKVG